MTLVQIDFTDAEDNGAAITGYQVQIQSADGEYYSASECDVSLAQQIDLTWRCEVSFTQLRGTPFFLPFDRLI